MADKIKYNPNTGKKLKKGETVTDNSGVIQWVTGGATTTVIDILAYW